MSWARRHRDGVPIDVCKNARNDERVPAFSTSTTDSSRHEPRTQTPAGQSGARWLSHWGKDEHATEPHGLDSLGSKMSELMVGSGNSRSPDHGSSATGARPSDSVADTLSAFEPPAGLSTVSDGISQGRTLLPQDQERHRRARRPQLSLETVPSSHSTSSHSMSFMSPLEVPQVTPAGTIGGRATIGGGGWAPAPSSRSTTVPWLASLDEEFAGFDDGLQAATGRKSQRHQVQHQQRNQEQGRVPRRAQTLRPTAQEWELSRQVHSSHASGGHMLLPHHPRPLPATRSWTDGSHRSRGAAAEDVAPRSRSARKGTPDHSPLAERGESSPHTAGSADAPEGGGSSGRFYDRRSHVATVNAFRKAVRHHDRSATPPSGHAPPPMAMYPGVGMPPMPGGMVFACPPMGYAVSHDGSVMWPVPAGGPPMYGGMWQWMPAAPHTAAAHGMAHPPAMMYSAPYHPRGGSGSADPSTAEGLAATGPAKEWDRVREQASKSGNFSYVGPATKTKVCRYVLARNNNHFGKTCTYIHPCRSLLVQGRCAHGKRCTDDHLCREHVWTGTCPRGGVEGGCGLLHLTQESDAEQLRAMFREWVHADGRPKSDEEMRGIIAEMEQGASPRAPCPFWFHDTQAGCKAGPECPFEHSGQLQLPTRPRPATKDIELAREAWERRRARTGEQPPVGLEYLDWEGSVGRATPPSPAPTRDGVAAALPSAGLPFARGAAAHAGASMASEGLGGPLAPPPFAMDEQLEAWGWAPASSEQPFSGRPPQR